MSYFNINFNVVLHGLRVLFASVWLLSLVCANSVAADESVSDVELSSESAPSGGLLANAEIDIVQLVLNYVVDTFEQVTQAFDKQSEDNNGRISFPQIEEAGLFPGIFAFSDIGLTISEIPFNRPSPEGLKIGQVMERPDIPVINREVTGITEQEGFTKPHIAPLRWSRDSRLGVHSQGGGEGQPMNLYLFAPEKLEQHFMDGEPGPVGLTSLDSYDLPFEKLSPHMGRSIQHTNICDPFETADGKKNPYTCGVNGEDDCYDVVLVSTVREIPELLGGTRDGRDGGTPTISVLYNEDRLVGTPLMIRVTNPKAADAAIADVEYGEPTYSKRRTGALFETVTPADGRILIGRRSYLPLTWVHAATGEIKAGVYDIFYSVSQPGDAPCDVTNWGEMYPITHAPYDPRVNKKYPFAMQPFRDSMGYVIPDGQDIKGTYPWIDKEAKNFSMQVGHQMLFQGNTLSNPTDNNKARYPLRCVVGDHCPDADNSKDNLFMIVGAWTNGKTVLLDGLLNDIDFKLGFNDSEQSYLTLYKQGSGVSPSDSHEVRVGSTRDFPYVPVFKDDEKVGEFFARNLSVFDSQENRFNYIDHMKPVKPNDVVWWMSSGRATEEVAFDDYLTQNAFIVSEMVAATKWGNNTWQYLTFYDGWNELLKGFVGDVKVENSATTLPDVWQVPRFGGVSNGRLEPVANGGISGKGMWFNGNNTSLTYAIAEQPQNVDEHYWFTSLFIEPRHTQEDEERLLIAFPDGSEVRLMGERSLRYYDRSQSHIHTVELPEFVAETRWTQLALLLHPEGEQVDLFVNGFPFDVLSFDDPKQAFRIEPGVLSLGAIAREPKGLLDSLLSIFTPSTNAFHGWMDEFKVFAYEPDLESACNYAKGTLVGLPDAYEGHLSALADAYPQAMHDRVSQDLALYGQTTFDRYACYHDYSGDDRAHLGNIPDGVVSLRASVHFPEGPVYHDAPRPDSSNNHFCLSCHTDDQATPGLRLDALVLNRNLDAKFDPRRQPSQSPATIDGNPLLGFLDDNGVASGVAPFYIDELMQPSSVGIAPQVHNVVLFDNEEKEPVQLIANGDTLSPDLSIKANVNGLVERVEFVLNGETISVLGPLFLLPVERLSSGENTLTVTAYLNDMASNVLSLTVSR